MRTLELTDQDYFLLLIALGMAFGTAIYIDEQDGTPVAKSIATLIRTIMDKGKEEAQTNES